MKSPSHSSSSKKSHTFRNTVLLALGFAIAVSILLSPTFLESFNNIRQTTEIGSYQDALEDSDTDEMLKEAEAYNRTIAEEQKTQAFSYRGEEAADEAYVHLLSADDGEKIGGTMAFLDIKKIDLYLPVVHGTREEDLMSAVGHMYGTSLPVGGESTHAVLAAHTGLKSADLFTNLTKMKKGDTFKIHVLGRVLIYTVDQIEVVLPNEEDPYLQIVDGKDYVTLYTCTPYGVNDHRLLVRGVRTGTEEEEISDASSKTTSLNRIAIVKTIGIGAIPVLIILAGILKGRHDRKKELARIAAREKAKKDAEEAAAKKKAAETAEKKAETKPSDKAEDPPEIKTEENPDGTSPGTEEKTEEKAEKEPEEKTDPTTGEKTDPTPEEKPEPAEKTETEEKKVPETGSGEKTGANPAEENSDPIKADGQLETAEKEPGEPEDEDPTEELR